jgi:spore coat polysaccharide biosynthesis protein SpsF
MGHGLIEPVWAVVAGRMGSSRLPGKTMADLAGKPSLWHIIERLRRVSSLDGVVVATTTDASDDLIRECAEQSNAPCYSGSAEDVLGRTLAAAQSVGARTIVQVTGDCPLVEPSVVERVIEVYRDDMPDYVSTVLGGETYPVGLDVEVFSTALLGEVERTTSDPHDREHVSTFIYGHPERYRLRGIEAEGDRRRPDLRMTLDTDDDLEVVRALYQALWPANPTFSIDDAIEFLDRNPDLARRNQPVHSDS